MIKIRTSESDFYKQNVSKFKIDDVNFAIFHFNVKKDSLKLYPDTIIITNEHLYLYKFNGLITKIAIKDAVITEFKEFEELDVKYNELNLNEILTSYIISYFSVDSKDSRISLNHIYVRKRNVEDYVYIKNK